VKLVGSRRAVQLLHKLTPRSAIVFADGSDSMVANPLSEQIARWTTAVAEGGASSPVLLGGECDSWPLCYRKLYDGHADFKACLRSGSAACYPNSGTVLGSAPALLRFFTAVRSLEATMLDVEYNDDQAAANRLYADRQMAKRNFSVALAVDGNACKRPALRTLRGRTLCHERSYDPLHEIRRSGEHLLFTRTVHDAMVEQRPLMVHSSGLHHRLDAAALGLTPAEARRTCGAAHARANWLKLLLPNASFLEHPVLLIDSVQGGVCNLTTLGELIGPMRAAS